MPPECGDKMFYKKLAKNGVYLFWHRNVSDPVWSPNDCLNIIQFDTEFSPGSLYPVTNFVSILNFRVKRPFTVPK